MLAAATMGILFVGPVIIGFIPVMVVGALIFLLGIELMQEALVDTWGKLHRLEYLTVLLPLFPLHKCLHLLTNLVFIGGDYRDDDGSLGLCVGNCRRDYPGLCQFCGANLTQVCYPGYVFRQDHRLDGSKTASPATIPARSRSADVDHETGQLSLLRDDCQRREHGARVDRRGEDRKSVV